MDFISFPLDVGGLYTGFGFLEDVENRGLHRRRQILRLLCLNQIGQQLAKTPQANAYPYYFKLVNEDSINAFALPGGPMYVHTGLIKATDNVTYWAKDDKARRELGYSPRPLEQGLRETLEADGRLPAGTR